MGWGFIGDAAGAVSDGVSSVAEGVTDLGGDVLDGALDLGGDVLGGAVDLFGEVGSGIIDLGSSLGDALGGLWDRATSWLGGLLSDFISSIVDAFNWVVDALSDWYGNYWELLRRLVEGFDAPDTLAATAEAWRSGPVTQLTGLGELVSEQALQADQGWSGPAGQAYVSTIPAQVGAVGAMTTVAGTTADTLTETSEGLMTLYAEAGGLTGRVYAAVNGSPGQLFSMEALLDLVGPNLLQLHDIAQAVSDFAGQMREKQAALGSQIQQNAAFPGGAWPQATTA